MTTIETLLLEERGHVTPTPRIHYIRRTVEVPPGTTRVTARLRFRKQRVCQLFLSLFDPAGFRGCHMQPGAQGEVDLVLWVAPEDASRGGIPGELPAGSWTIQIDVERTAEVAEYLLTVVAEQGEPRPALSVSYPEGYVSRAAAGWYRGELHAHSHESDGKTPVAEVVRAAKLLGLDYLALTDHFTTSGYRHLAELHSPELALLRGMELTAHFGHANLHGIRRWHDLFVDGGAGWDINAVAREVRAAGGLFCVNHPFAADLGWRYHGFDWGLADMLEVYHIHEGPGNLLAIGLWDELLRQGRHVVGVAATDSHDPYAPRHRLGTVLTAVYAEELSEAGVLDGLRAGRVYGTRGPHLELSATPERAPDRVARIGERVAAGPLVLRCVVERASHPWRLHILKNGFAHEVFEGPAGERHVIELRDEADAGAYYRAELHAIPHYSDFPYQKWREWETMLAFTNPVFVG
jgi:hypothetical protein